MPEGGLPLSPNILRYGVDEPLPEQIPLRAGSLSLVYEAGDLRYIRLGDREIVRRLYVAVRDRNWGTVPGRLANVDMRVESDTFQISYDVQHRQREIDFAWSGTITGDRNGTIAFTMDGVARSTFLRNRIGFCVLHPVRECAGQPCEVAHADGTIEIGSFPDQISPHQPFLEMQAIAHEVTPGLRAELRFSGDIFEMEDQRNWTDASYKTYCTPLRLPFPVELRAGTRVAQSVTLSLHGVVPEQPPETESRAVSLSIGGDAIARLPKIGLCVASDGKPLEPDMLDRLRDLNLSHLRVDLRLSDPAYADQLTQASHEAHKLRVPLVVALHLSDAAEDELEALLPVLHGVKPEVAAWLIFHTAEKSTREQWVRLARRVLNRYDAAAQIGAGTNAYFTELNRDRPPVEALDFVGYSISPQVHAFDNTSLVETLATQAETVRSARHFVDRLPLWVSPVTLRPRANPNATGSGPELEPGELPPEVDPRQMSLFGAAWTVGSLKYLAEQSVDSITFYETGGWRGVMERAEGSPVPERFRSLPGAVFPLYHVLADAGELADADVLPLTSTHPLRADGFALRRGDRLRIVVANLRNEQQELVIGPLAGEARVRLLDETTVLDTIMEPEAFRTRGGETRSPEAGSLRLSLRPYAVACVDTYMPAQPWSRA